MAISAKTRVAAPTAPATEEQETSTNDSSKSGPIWKTKSGRVQGAIWRRPQEGNKMRYTIAISRSYLDKEDKEWKNVHFFDEDDLPHVDVVSRRAADYLSPIESK